MMPDADRTDSINALVSAVFGSSGVDCGTSDYSSCVAWL